MLFHLQLLESFETSYPELKFPALPKRGNFDLQQVLNSPYFFNWSSSLCSLPYAINICIQIQMISYKIDCGGVLMLKEETFGNSSLLYRNEWHRASYKSWSLVLYKLELQIPKVRFISLVGFTASLPQFSCSWWWRILPPVHLAFDSSHLIEADHSFVAKPRESSINQMWYAFAFSVSYILRCIACLNWVLCVGCIM